MKKIILILLFISAAWCAYNLFAPHGQIVEIVLDGQVLDKLNLSKEQDRQINISSHLGFNVLQIEDGTIRVVKADCPNHDCIKMGILRSATLPLVCLPHHLTVRFAQSSKQMLDSIAQ